MQFDFLIYLGLGFFLSVGCLILCVKIKSLFRQYRKLKTDSDAGQLRNSAGLLRACGAWDQWLRSLNTRSRRSESFMNACRSGSLEIVEKLIQSGVDTNVRRHKGGRTGLMLAARKNQIEVVKLLLGKGADPNLVGGGSGKTALIRAAERGNIQVVRLLVDHGADLNVRAKSNGRTALMRAGEAGFLEIVKYLVEKGADINLMDASGRTALVLALSPTNKYSYDTVELLITAGADLNMVDDRGDSPLDRARELRLKACEETLVCHGAVSGGYKKLLNQPSISEAEKLAYETLACKESDSDYKIRKIFHEMVRTYHPDSISHKDLPEDLLVSANERFLEVQKAYKTIMSSRKNSHPK